MRNNEPVHRRVPVGCQQRASSISPGMASLEIATNKKNRDAGAPVVRAMEERVSQPGVRVEGSGNPRFRISFREDSQ
jgi:hypothetical protein